jgi:hypothetical protein
MNPTHNTLRIFSPEQDQIYHRDHIGVLQLKNKLADWKTVCNNRRLGKELGTL